MRVKLYSILTLLIVSLGYSCAPQMIVAHNQYTISDLKSGRYVEDTSYIYALPYKARKKYRLVQAYHSKIMSHQNEFALDFKMKTGTAIHAARPGVVAGLKEDSDEGGIGDQYLSKGNYVIVKHTDSTYAGYWHLKVNGVAVEIGQSIRKGQLIGYSGNTGYSAFPHLHFWIFSMDKNGNRVSLPCRFETKSGVRYLRPGIRYQRVL